MSERVLAWVVRAVWALAPFTLWPSLAAALRAEGGAVRTTAAVGGWVLWGGVLLGTLVPRAVGLTALRCAAPGAGAAAIAAAATGHPGTTAAAVAIAWSVVTVALALLPQTGTLFVNGAAYPNERRFLLRPPAALLLGPLEVAWAATTLLPAAAVLLLAGEQWIAGAIAAAASVPSVRYLGRAVHGLNDRWLVFVPAGVVLHDGMALADPVLFRRQEIDSLGPAGPGDGLDLPQRASGVALELRLARPVPVLPRGGEQQSPARLVFAPTQPGAVLVEASRRHIRVGALT